ncbi:hypothetical protein TWF694_011701 [Orbilia ellipsospora]|uniref:Peptidase S8/S53 domain-containing protein n=1 Tax=Orbilia ellipsospora TaxID=2528407 RepID=A0AAV9X615_9PEZI
MKSFSLVSISLLLAAATEFVYSAPTARGRAPESIKQIRRRGLEKGERTERYIVVLKEAENRTWGEVFNDMGYDPTDVEDLKATPDFRMLKAFSRSFTLAMHNKEKEGVAALSNIAYVQKDHIRFGAGVRIEDSRFNSVIKPKSKNAYRFPTIARRDGQPNIQTQNNAGWSLGRISSKHTINKNGRDVNTLNFRYTFDAPCGSGVDVYVLDSGVNVNHVEFQGRAKNLFTAFNGDFRDEFGHGSNVAGIVGSRAYGVSKKVNILSLRVLDANNSGSDSNFIEALQAVVTNHNKRKTEKGFVGSVVNFSIGGRGDNDLLEKAFQQVFAAGIHVTNSAMNANEDACTWHPQRYSQNSPMITVGNADIDDKKAADSNFGACVTLHGPGEFIISANNTDNEGISIFSGTSQASPGVAGVIADLMLRFPKLRSNPQAMKEFLVKTAGGNVAGATGGNKILNNVINFDNDP